MVWRLLILLKIIASLSFAFAQTEPPQFMTVDGRLYDSTTPEFPLLDNSVLMKIQILDPAKTCILYEEEQTVSTLSSNGYFNVRVGSPTSGAESLKRTTSTIDVGNSMMEVFQNQNASIAGKTSSGVGCGYTPVAGDTRYFRFVVTPSTTGVTSTLSPDMQIDSVPQSLVAETLQGMTPANFVQTNTDVTQAKVNTLFGASYTTLSGLLAGSSSLYLQNTTNGTLIPSRATNPASPSAGQIWYDSDDFVLRYFDGSVVQTLSSGSADPTKLPLAGGTMAGAIDMGTNDITDIGHMTQAPQRTFRFGVYTTAQQTTLIATPLIAGHEGTVWYNTTTNKLMFWDGTAEYAVSPVDSVFGRTGAVVAAAGDYDANQIDNTAAGTIAATDVQAALNELDTEKVAKAGDTMTGALNIDNEQELRLSEADGSGANYVAIKSLTTLAANYTLTLPPDDGNSGQYLQTDGNGVLTWVTPAGVGETNTASNQGAGGVGVFKQKTTFDLEFRNINAASNKVSVALDAGNNEIDINVAEANLDLGAIPNTPAGTIAAITAQTAINELDSEKVAKIGDSMTGALTFDAQTQARFADSAGGEYAAIQAPATIGANYVLTLPDTAGSASQVLTTNGAGILSWTTPSTTPAADSLDFTHFADSMTLDASTDIAASGSNVLSITNSGTGDSFLVNDVAADTSPFVINASGSVGIGTTAPVRNLSILNSINDTSVVSIETPGTQANQSSQIELQSLSNGSILGTSAGNKGWQIYGRGNAWSTAGERNDLGFSYWNGTSWINPLRMDSATGNVGIGTITPGTMLDVAGAMTSRPFGTATGETGQLILRELAAGGSETVTVRAPDAITTSYALTLPNSAGAANQVLTTDGAGILSWTASGAGSIAADALDFDKFIDAMTLDASTDIAASGTNVLSVTNSGTGDSFRVNDQAADTTPFVINASGNVGIGSSAPTAGLQISNAAGTHSDYISVKRGSTDWRIYPSDSVTGTPSMRIGGNVAGKYAWQFDWSGADANVFRSANDDASQNVINVLGATSQSGKYFAVSAAGGSTGDILSIQATGAVGIGTTTPGSRLDVAGAITSRPYGTATGETGQMIMRELAAGGTETATIRAPDAITTSYALTLPNSAGAANQVLTTDGAGILSWTASGAGSIAADALDFDKFIDAMTLDASTDIAASGTRVLSITNSGTGNSFRVNDASGDTSPFVIDDNGNVGIWTTTPGAKLDISTSPVSRSFSIDPGSNTAPAYAGLIVTNSSAAFSTGIGDVGFYSGDGNGIYFLTGSGSGRSIRFSILPDGKIGVGTRNPVSLQDVSSATGAVSTLSRNDTTAVANDSIGVLQFWNNDTELTTQNIFGNIEMQAAQTIAGDAAPGKMIFRTTGTTVAGSPIERMVIDESGNVTVGNSMTASSLLDVAGAITSRPFGTATGETGQLVLRELSAGGTQSATIRAPDAITTSYALTLPNSAGAANQVLTTDGAGILSWTTTGAGSIAADTLDFDKFIDTMTLDASTDIAASGTNVLSVTNTGTGDSFRVNDQAADTTPFVIDAAGQVGIGTTTPGSVLDVYGTSASQLQLFNVINSQAAASGVGPRMGFQGSGTSNMAFISARWQAAANTDADMTFSTRGSGSVTEKVRIEAAGNVGIGTTAPSTKLDVFGVVRATDAGSSGNYVELSSSGTGNTYVQLRHAGASKTAEVQINSSTSLQWALGKVDSSGSIGDGDEFFIGQTSGGANANLWIEPAGNVGIGTTVPGTVLDVAGALTSRPSGTGTGQTGQLIMRELAAGGTETAAIRAPDAITTSYALTLPTTAGSSGQLLRTDGSGALSWVNADASITADSLDFTHLADSMTLDASTDIAVSGTNILSITNSGTGNSFVVNDQAADTSPFVIDASGNIGVGTTAPGTKMHIIGSALLESGTLQISDGINPAKSFISRFATTNNAYDMTIEASQELIVASGEGSTNLRSNVLNPGGEHLSLASDSSIYFWTGLQTATGATTPPMIIGANGNVGIGTTVPGTILDAAGAITSRPNGTATGQTGQLMMRELAAGGTDTATIRAPDAITTSYALTLPTTAGSSGQLLSTDGSGALSWVNADASITADSLDFTLFADAMTLDASTDISVTGTNVLSITNSGTGNSFIVNDQAGDTSPFVIDATGNMGVGTTAPGSSTKLDVNGQIRTPASSISDGAVDFVGGNTVITSFDCGTNITLANIRRGGSYTVIVTGAGTTMCSFSTAATGDDAATVAYRFQPANGVRTASSHTIYSLLRVGDIIYVSWITGFI